MATAVYLFLSEAKMSSLTAMENFLLADWETDGLIMSFCFLMVMGLWEPKYIYYVKFLPLTQDMSTDYDSK